MTTYNPGMVVQREDEGDFAKIRVDDFKVAELLNEVIDQLRLVSMKLDCLQPDDDEINNDELDIDIQ